MSLTPALVALLNAAGGATPLYDCDFFTFTLQDGTRLYYADNDFAVTAGDKTVWNPPAIDGSGGMWQPGLVWRPGIVASGQGQTATWKVGLDVNGWSLVISPRLFDPITGATFPDKIGSVGWIEAAQAGSLDNADVIVSTAYFSAIPIPALYNGSSPVGTLTTFRGAVGAVDVSDSEIYLGISDYRYLANQNMPRNLYQGSCGHRLYDERCTLLAASFSRTGVVSGASSRAIIVSTPAVAAPGGSATFTLGILTITSGANNGFSRLVTSWDGSATFNLLAPFPFTISGGETFTVQAGCDKTTTTCTAFANIANFGGNPYVPIPEVSLG